MRPPAAIEESFCHAVLSGKEDEALVILTNNPGISLDWTTTSDGENPVHIAAARGMAKFIRAALSRKPGLIGHYSEKGENPLHTAARAGHLEAVRALLEHIPYGDIDYLSSNRESYSALRLASVKNHWEVASLIIDTLEANRASTSHNPTDTKTKIEYGICLFYAAQRRDQSELVIKLLRLNAAIITTKMGDTVAHMAIKDDNTVIYGELAKYVDYVFYTDRTKKTPLEIAAQEGKWAIVAAFTAEDQLSAGIKAHEKFQEVFGKILIAAIKKGERVVINNLIAADVYSFDVFLAAINRGDIETIRAFMNKHKGRIFKEAGFNFGPLETATIPSETKEAIYSVLLNPAFNAAHVFASRGEITNLDKAITRNPELLFSVDAKGKIPFELAIDAGECFCAELMARKIESLEKNGQRDLLCSKALFSLLNKAVTDSSRPTLVKIARKLIADGASMVDPTTNNTLLHVAIYLGDQDFIRETLTAHPDQIHIINTDGRTPMYLAYRNCKAEEFNRPYLYFFRALDNEEKASELRRLAETIQTMFQRRRVMNPYLHLIVELNKAGLISARQSFDLLKVNNPDGSFSHLGMRLATTKRSYAVEAFFNLLNRIRGEITDLEIANLLCSGPYQFSTSIDSEITGRDRFVAREGIVQTYTGLVMNIAENNTMTTALFEQLAILSNPKIEPFEGKSPGVNFWEYIFYVESNLKVNNGVISDYLKLLKSLSDNKIISSRDLIEILLLSRNSEGLNLFNKFATIKSVATLKTCLELIEGITTETELALVQTAFDHGVDTTKGSEKLPPSIESLIPFIDTNPELIMQMVRNQFLSLDAMTRLAHHLNKMKTELSVSRSKSESSKRMKIYNIESLLVSLKTKLAHLAIKNREIAIEIFNPKSLLGRLFATDTDFLKQILTIVNADLISTAEAEASASVEATGTGAGTGAAGAGGGGAAGGAGAGTAAVEAVSAEAVAAGAGGGGAAEGTGAVASADLAATRGGGAAGAAAGAGATVARASTPWGLGFLVSMWKRQTPPPSTASHRRADPRDGDGTAVELITLPSATNS